MCKLLILILLQNIIFGYDIDKLIDNSEQKTTFNVSNEAKSINKKLKKNTEELSKKQLDFLAKLLATDMQYSIQSAKGWCYMIEDEDSRYGCLSGIELSKENIDKAKGWCYMVENKDSRNGCLAGIQLAKEDINQARGWCYMIENKDSRHGCLSDVLLIGYFIKENEKMEHNYQRQIYQTEQELNQLENELKKDKLEAKKLLEEFNNCIECLQDPEMKQLYLQLQGDIK